MDPLSRKPLPNSLEVAAAVAAYERHMISQYREGLPPRTLWVNAPTTEAENLALEIVREDMRNEVPGLRAPIRTRSSATAKSGLSPTAPAQ
jgi:hypothetical protein